MKKRISRFGYLVGAAVLGVALVAVLTFMGDKSSGPLEDFFQSAGAMISNVESRLIMRNRKRKRSASLEWLQPYRTDREKLLHPDIILLGAFDNETTKSYESIIELEDSLETVFPLIHIYTAWGDQPHQRFPSEHVQAILDLGSIPFITWEPWLTDFDGEKHPDLPPREERDKNGLSAIANGVYDFYLARWASEAKAVPSQIFVRFGHEMNDAYRYPWGPQNNSPDDFIRAWQYVHDYFRMAGVDNVLWVWSPHPAYQQFDAYYPGDDYVDWVGVGTLNYGTVAQWSQWWTFQEIFGNYYDDLAKYTKPIILTEFASLPVGGNRAEWYAHALNDLPARHPLVKGLMFFHFSQDNTTTYKALDWYIKEDSLATRAIINGIQSWPDSLSAPVGR